VWWREFVVEQLVGTGDAQDDVTAVVVKVADRL